MVTIKVNNYMRVHILNLLLCWIFISAMAVMASEAKNVLISFPIMVLSMIGSYYLLKYEFSNNVKGGRVKK